MADFGHKSVWVGGAIIDSWGKGPFVIVNDGKSFRFEDSDQFGPWPLREDNEIKENYWWSKKSPFWPAFAAWRNQGRRVAEDGVTCIWDHLKPTKIYRLGGEHAVIIEQGDEGGATVDVTDEMKAKGVNPSDFLDKMARRQS